MNVILILEPDLDLHSPRSTCKQIAAAVTNVRINQQFTSKDRTRGPNRTAYRFLNVVTYGFIRSVGCYSIVFCQTNVYIKGLSLLFYCFGEIKFVGDCRFIGSYWTLNILNRESINLYMSGFCSQH